MSAFGIPDRTLVAAHLADLRELTDVERESYDELAREGVPVQHYEGEVTLPCKDCARMVCVGPRSQLAISLGAELACMTCAARECSTHEYSVKDLGNEGGRPL